MQEEIILTARSRLFTLGAKGFHLPQVDLSVRVGEYIECSSRVDESCMNIATILLNRGNIGKT